MNANICCLILSSRWASRNQQNGLLAPRWHLARKGKEIFSSWTQENIWDLLELQSASSEHNICGLQLRTNSARISICMPIIKDNIRISLYLKCEMIQTFETFWCSDSAHSPNYWPQRGRRTRSQWRRPEYLVSDAVLFNCLPKGSQEVSDMTRRDQINVTCTRVHTIIPEDFLPLPIRDHTQEDR